MHIVHSTLHIEKIVKVKDQVKVKGEISPTGYWLPTTILWYFINMRLEHIKQKELEKKISSILNKYLDLKDHRVFFFGSRVSEKGDDRSDIDIGIEGRKPISLLTLGKIKEEIDDLNILYKIDIVDFKQVASDFREVALQNIEIINE